MKLVSYLLIGAGTYFIVRGLTLGTAEAADIPAASQQFYSNKPKWEYTSDDIWQAIIEASRKFNIDPNFLSAIAEVESHWDPRAVDPAHSSFGVMQMTMPTAKWMGYTGNEEGLYNPYTNVYYAAKYLAWLRDRPNVNGDLRKMAMGYNGGPDLGPVSITSRYADKVMTAYYKLRGGK